MPGCATCASPKRAEMESFGQRALLGELSWRQAALLAGANNPKSLQNHMQTHFNHVPESGDTAERLDAIKREVEEALLAQAEASHNPDEKARIWLKLKELRSPNIRPDVLIRIWKEERELDSQKGIAAALTMFGRQMFIQAGPAPLAIEAAEVIDVAEAEESEPQS